MDVGFVGLGNMGSRMARNIVTKGTAVLGFDPVRENVERTGAEVARSLAAQGASYVDAGVSGGAAAAEKGTLTLMVGGDFLNGINLSASAEVLIAGAKAGLDMGRLLEVINASSGANWATENRFPPILRGDYLEGGLTSALMMKDLLLYVEHLRELGVPSFHATGPVAAFGVALQTGRGEAMSNHVVDALGDLAGGVRLNTDTSEGTAKS